MTDVRSYGVMWLCMAGKHDLSGQTFGGQNTIRNLQVRWFLLCSYPSFYLAFLEQGERFFSFK